MPDISQPWGNDISLSPTGDILLVDGDDLTREHLVRRLMTAVRGYLWHLTFGAGLPQRIGDNLDVDVIRGVVSAQVRKEELVATTPAPVITVRPFLNGVTVLITYQSAVTGRQTTLSFDASN